MLHLKLHYFLVASSLIISQVLSRLISIIAVSAIYFSLFSSTDFGALDIYCSSNLAFLCYC
jgi:hypothetical protein